MVSLMNNLLFTEDAEDIYEAIKPYYTEDELIKYQFVMAQYCNELAFFQKISKEMAELESAVTAWTNSKNKCNLTKHELTRARAESFDIVQKLQKELRLTPKSANQKSELKIDLDMP